MIGQTKLEVNQTQGSWESSNTIKYLCLLQKELFSTEGSQPQPIGPKPTMYLFLSIEFTAHSHAIHLNIIYVTLAKLNSCHEDHIAHKA